MELLIARNPDPESSLPYLLRLLIAAAGPELAGAGARSEPRRAPLSCTLTIVHAVSSVFAVIAVYICGRSSRERSGRTFF